MTAIFETSFFILLGVLMLLSVVIIPMRAFVIEEIKKRSPAVANQLGQPSSFLNTPTGILFNYQFIIGGKYKHAALNDSLNRGCRRLALFLYAQHFIAIGCIFAMVVLNQST